MTIVCLHAFDSRSAPSSMPCSIPLHLQSDPPETPRGRLSLERHDLEGACSRNPTNISMLRWSSKPICLREISILIDSSRRSETLGPKSANSCRGMTLSPSYFLGRCRRVPSQQCQNPLFLPFDLQHAHPVSVPINHPKEIQALSHVVTYCKTCYRNPSQMQ